MAAFVVGRSKVGSTARVGGATASTYIGAQEATPRGMAFKADGTKVYVVGSTSNTIHQYSLATAWDISTATYDNVSKSISAQTTDPNGLFFKPDGTKMWLTSSADMYEYTLSSAWVVSSATYAGVSVTLTQQGAAETAYKDIFIRSDGLKLFAVGTSTDTVRRFDPPTTAWTFSSDTQHDSNIKLVSAQDLTPTGLFFKDDGTRMFITGPSSGFIYQYALSTAYDLTTATYSGLSLSHTAYDTSVSSIRFNTTGTRLFILGRNNDSIYQIDLAAAWNLGPVVERTFNDSLGLSDSSSQVTTHVRISQEPLLDESGVPILDENNEPITVDGGDRLGLTDSISQVFTPGGTNHTQTVAPAQNLGLTDSITTLQTVIRSQSDSLGLTDSRSQTSATTFDITLEFETQVAVLVTT
jgi:sugar lactone lactonase YvrE